MTKSFQMSKQSKPIRSFEDLRIYKLAREFSHKISELIRRLPEDEKYNLKEQMRRAKLSMTNNIAEGYGRYHYQENIQFCRQARGSLYELIDHVGVATECRYLEKQRAETLINEIESAIKMLNGYIRYLKIRKGES